MRNPPQKALICLALAAAGYGLLLVGIALFERDYEVAGGLLGIAGLGIGMVSLVVALWMAVSSIGYVRLLAGRNVIARWQVSAAEWDRFRAFDAVRATEHPVLRNDLRLRPRTPPRGVEIIVGRRSLIVDGSHHGITGRAVAGRQINWIDAPADPGCLEFPKTYARSKGGTVDLTLRVPVPASARAEGIKVFEFFRAQAKS